MLWIKLTQSVNFQRHLAHANGNFTNCASSAFAFPGMRPSPPCDHPIKFISNKLNFAGHIRQTVANVAWKRRRSNKSPWRRGNLAVSICQQSEVNDLPAGLSRTHGSLLASPSQQSGENWPQFSPPIWLLRTQVGQAGISQYVTDQFQIDPQNSTPTTNPLCKACLASIGSPVRHIFIANDFPTKLKGNIY